jgi:TP901 family phage tail tape measure protein
MSKLFQIAFQLSAKLASTFNSTFQNAGTRVNKLQQQLANQQALLSNIQNFAKLQQQIQNAGVPTAQMATKLQQLQNSLQSAGINTNNLAHYQQLLQNQLNGTTSSLQRQQKYLTAQQNFAIQKSKAMSAWGGVAATSATFGLATGVPLKQAAEAEYQQQLIANTVGLTKQQQIELNQKVAEYAKLTNQTQAELTKGISAITGAGIDYATAMGLMKTLGKTATATNSEIEEVAKTLGAVNSNLKISTTESLNAMDILLVASKAGNVEFKDMATYLPTITAGAASLGIQGKAGLASLAAGAEIARKGAGTAEEAFNNQKNFLMKITSKEFVKNAAKVGINMKTELAKGLASGDLLGHLTEKFKTYAKGDKFKLSALFTDMQAQNYINAQIQNFDEYKKMRDQALGSSGEINRDYDKILSTTKEQMKATQISAEQLSLTMGKSLFPVFNQLLQSLSPMLTSMANFIAEHQTLVKVLASVALGFISVQVAMASFSTVVAMVKGSLVLARGAVILFNLAMMANPAFLVGGAIIGLIAILTLFFTKCELGKQIWASMVNGMTSGIEFVVQSFKNLINFVSVGFEKIAGVFNNIKSIFGGGSNLSASINQSITSSGLKPSLFAQSSQQLATTAKQSSATNNKTNNFTYAPNITVNGSADKQQIQKVVNQEGKSFGEMLRNQQRLAY